MVERGEGGREVGRGGEGGLEMLEPLIFCSSPIKIFYFIS